ncbi:hypothetical protein PuT2_14025 [Pusillimonas sp. T2]|uniref:ADP-ribosyltransferase-containing protein n=1 Tax=Pusillimonas sp. T2 TaxID=1548123 RepID=UPI000B9CEC69|nr:hypothetical protein [Pusillimonas sp. T2]OXR48137.1 hypothetical protein PuT2_14025 [Pusillimonas sp. T2]
MQIFGYDFSDIQRAQQGGRLSRPVNTQASSQITLSQEDIATLEHYGSLQAVEQAGLHGVADRVRRSGHLVEHSPEAVSENDVQSAQFKDWFGASKIVDTQGEPLMVYHGTNQQFSQFSKEHLGHNTGFDNTQLGFYFIADKTAAANFALETSGGARVIKAYLSIHNPLDLTVQGLFSNADQAPTIWEILSGERLAADQALEALNEEVGLGDLAEALQALSTSEAKLVFERDGFDGAVSRFGGDYLEYVAFKAEQIKVIGDVDNNELLQAPVAQTGNFTLLVGDHWSFNVSSLAQAVQVYSRLRDQSEQGARDFPSGRILGSSALLRISYNGRVWNGDQAVDVDPAPPEPPGSPLPTRNDDISCASGQVLDRPKMR